MAAKRGPSRDLECTTSDRVAISVNIEGSVRRADDNCNRPALAAFWMPVIVIGSQWTEHFRGEIFRRQHEAGVRGKMRLRRFAVAYYDGAAFRSRAEKQLREIEGKPDAA